MAMVEQQLRRRGIVDERVLAAMRVVPREAFAPENADAYADRAWPIDHGQTISQPYMVARALELARVQPTDRALEVGLGSGYQAAVLARLCMHVIGVEIVPELAAHAKETLGRIGENRVDVRQGDGSLGFAPGGPYDVILVAAGAPSVPDALVAQLAPGGRLVIPVGNEQMQHLLLLEHAADGTRTSEHDACAYVPLRGAHGWH
jgi:protein-L-isoaspartate(D-aspartate) O-methyltransferase